VKEKLIISKHSSNSSAQVCTLMLLEVAQHEHMHVCMSVKSNRTCIGSELELEGCRK